VGAALGVAEDAAQKRVAGAIERLARFFQRRGFRTATAAAATAALQQTVASASATTTTSVVGAALEAAPHAMSGVAALLARLVSLSKPQVAMLCAAVVVIPVGWAASEHRNAAAEAKRLENEMQAAQTEHSELQSEVEHLRTSLEQLAGLLAQKDEDTTTNAWVIHQFEQWKAKVRAKLTAADYRWPNDSPFVRIPKSVVPKLAAHRPISSPGIISEELRDLLGLTQEERTQVETALRNHFTDMDKLIESRLYETDKTWRVRIPESAVASKVWEVPPLGDEAGARREELLATLKAALGDERWSFFEKDLRMRGTDTLYRILNLGADETAQEAAAWVREEQGKYVVGFAWGERNSMFSSGGQALETFLPGAELPTGLTVEQSLGVRELSPALTGPVLEWVQAQAVSKLEGGFGK
jgi:hypothetical protein